MRGRVGGLRRVVVGFELEGGDGERGCCRDFN